MSLEWNEQEIRFLIDERKNGNEEYHQTPKRSKRIFWEEIANKLNQMYNTNYFTGEDCNKKFLTLTRAYYTTKAYKEGSKKKRSLIGEQYYAEFSTEFRKDPEAQQHPNKVTPSSSPNTPRGSQSSRIPRPISHSQVPVSTNTSSRAGTASKIPRVIPSPNISRPTTPTVSRPSSRPVTPSFSQNAETINIFINYNEPDQE